MMHSLVPLSLLKWTKRPPTLEESSCYVVNVLSDLCTEVEKAASQSAVQEQVASAMAATEGLQKQDLLWTP